MVPLRVPVGVFSDVPARGQVVVLWTIVADVPGQSLRSPGAAPVPRCSTRRHHLGGAALPAEARRVAGRGPCRPAWVDPKPWASAGISAASTARSAHFRRGFGWVLRSTATSWRRTSNSTSLAADQRPSNTSQPTSLTKIRYSNRNDTAHDHASHAERPDRRRSRTQADFWNPTGIATASGVHRTGDPATIRNPPWGRDPFFGARPHVSIASARRTPVRGMG
jgi:hypothetical protein